MPLTWNSMRRILLKSHRRDICHLSNLLLLHMSIWGTSVRGEVSKGKHALVFQMNTARLEPEGFLQRLTPKNLFLVLKQLQLLKIQLLLFLAQLLVLDMLLLPYPLPLVHLYSLGRVQGHTHKHSSKAKSRKPHFPDAGLRLLGQNSSKQCGILYVAEAGWQDTARHSKRKEKDYMYFGVNHCQRIKQEKCCSYAQQCTPWPELSHKIWIYRTCTSPAILTAKPCKSIKQFFLQILSTILPQMPESNSFSLTLCIQFYKLQRDCTDEMFCSFPPPHA